MIRYRISTSSLQAAFEDDLDMKPSMHGSYLMPHVKRLKLFYCVCFETDRSTRHSMLRQLFDGYRATSDIPGASVVEDLLQMYPDAKLLLNVRSSPQTWERSFRDSLAFFSTKIYLMLTYWVPQSYWHHQVYKRYTHLQHERYGKEIDPYSAACYELHNQWVRDWANTYNRPILEWESSDGWKPLCRFLEKPVPNKEFPRVNDAAFLRRLTQYLIARGLLAWACVLTTPLIAVVAVLWARGSLPQT